MLTLYARFNDDELREIAGHCRDFCYLRGDPSVSCTECKLKRPCKDFANLADHCQTLINRRKSAHC